MPSPAQELSTRIGYEFRDESLLLQALTHKSFVNENRGESTGDNERLELLGDAVLDLVITEYIAERFESRSEGQLSKLRAGLVSEKALASVARSLDLGREIRMGRGEAPSGGAEKDSILSDALEAVIAAIYLDSKAQTGISTIERVVRSIFEPRLREAEQLPHRGDFKTELQEIVQKKLHKRTIYRVLKEEGPDHEKQYEVGVYVEDIEYGRGQGPSKKQSEQLAAKEALNRHFWNAEAQ